MKRVMRNRAVSLIDENIRGIRYAMQPASISRSIAAHLFKANEVNGYIEFSLDKIEVYTAVVEHLISLTEEELI